MAWRLEPEVADAFRGAGLDFHQLISGNVGEQIASEAEREVRRFVIKDASGSPLRLILKRNWEPIPWSWVCKKVVCGRVQRSRPWMEANALRALSAAGFPVNQPVAWGERRRRGLPLGGFIVVREIDGVEARDVWRAGGARVREELLDAAAALLGRLHADRFVEVVRLKDLFCVRGPGDLRRPLQLVMIDREISRGRELRVSRSRMMKALAESYVNFIEVGLEPTPRELIRFIDSYRRMVPKLTSLSTREFLRAASEAMLAASARSSYAACRVETSRYRQMIGT